MERSRSLLRLRYFTRQGYEGFRTGVWTGKGGPQLFAHFGKPWSLLNVKPDPFPVPSAVVIGTKNVDASKSSALPGIAEGLSGKVKTSGNWEVAGVDLVVEDVPVIAVTSDDLAGSSLYKERFRNGATLFPRVLVFVEDIDPLPLATKTQRSVRSRQGASIHKPWSSVPDLVGAVEAHFIRKVLLGESIVPFLVVNPLEAIIPSTPGEQGF